MNRVALIRYKMIIRRVVNATSFFSKKKAKNKLSSCPCMELNISLHFYLYLKKTVSGYLSVM